MISYKILLIDDDKDDREIFHDAVAKVCPEVSCESVENGTTLLTDIANGELAQPDIIFLDINIPEMSGWECLSMLKENSEFGSIPIIMYSTSSHIEEAMKAKKAGALSFFSKPYDFRELQEALKEVVDHLRKNLLYDLPKNSKRFF